MNVRATTVRRASAIASVLAMLLSGGVLIETALGERRAWSTPADPRLERIRHDLARSVRRIDELEHGRWTGGLREPLDGGRAGGRAANGPPEPLEPLSARLARIETMLAMGPGSLHFRKPRSGLEPMDPVELYYSARHHESVAHDASLPPEVRARAFRALGSLDDRSLVDERTADLALALARRTDVAPDARHDALMGLQHRPFERVRGTALDLLLFDPSAKVRRAAVIALERYPELDDEIRFALERARDLDPSPRVRRYAADALEGM